MEQGPQDTLELSPFRIQIYKQCPRKYKWIYIDRIWDEYKKPRPYLDFGNSLHLTLRDYYRIGGPQRHDLEKLLSIYEGRWVSKGYESPAQEEEYRQVGQQALILYFKAHRDKPIRIVFAERTLRTKLPTVGLFGKIDRLDLTEDESFEVVDYKTGKSRIGEDEAEDALALPIYDILVKANYGDDRVVKVTRYMLRENKAESRIEPPERLEQVRMEVSRIAETITGDTDFAATPNRFCRWCDFLEICEPGQTIAKADNSGSRTIP
jgi:putative RecB family exonuclease